LVIGFWFLVLRYAMSVAQRSQPKTNNQKPTTAPTNTMEIE
jgi:hypothetical protein